MVVLGRVSPPLDREGRADQQARWLVFSQPRSSGRAAAQEGEASTRLIAHDLTGLGRHAACGNGACRDPVGDLRSVDATAFTQPLRDRQHGVAMVFKK